MAIPARDHGFHLLRVRRVVRETADASSFVLDVPPDLRAAFAYEAGQFCTFRVVVDGETHLRCYSMSSAPGVDPELQVTVKRVPGGVVSNWMVDTLGPGDTVEVTCPAGVFRLPDAGTDAGGGRDVVAFCAGSGITPVFSLVKAALAGAPGRRVRLLYANRDRDAVIFAAELDALVARHPDRLAVTHRLDVEDGFVDAAAVRSFLGPGGPGDADLYLCGPTPFMDVVEAELLAAGADPARVHVERFTPGGPDPTGPVAEADGDAGDRDGQDGGGGAVTKVTVDLDGRVGTTDHHPGTTILQTARQLGMAPPFSCESGSCATCMARLVEGTADMFVNNALTDDEVAEGWVLTCQAVPTSPAVHVVYGYEGG
jgi:ferredoxin-NADP reductase